MSILDGFDVQPLADMKASINGPHRLRAEAMRCLFCKAPSDAATSVEYVIPQSLGNSQVALPRSTICDPCNNYIARKIEQLLLAHESFRNLRAWYRIPNKRGRHASLFGVIPGLDTGVNFRIGQEGPELQLERGGEAAAKRRREVR